MIWTALSRMEAVLCSQSSRGRRRGQKSSQCPVKVGHGDKNACTVWERVGKDLMVLKNPEWRLGRQVRAHAGEKGLQAGGAA